MIRAKNAMQETENVIRIGTSPMTPAQLLMQQWPRIQAHCPDIKFQIVPFENTPENAREILGNLGRNIDVLEAFLMIPCWICEAVRGWNCQESLSAVLSPSITDLQQRTD